MPAFPGPSAAADGPGTEWMEQRATSHATTETRRAAGIGPRRADHERGQGWSRSAIGIDSASPRYRRPAGEGRPLRTEFPYTDNANWLRRIVVRREAGEGRTRFEPVRLKYLRPKQVPAAEGGEGRLLRRSLRVARCSGSAIAWPRPGPGSAFPQARTKREGHAGPSRPRAGGRRDRRDPRRTSGAPPPLRPGTRRDPPATRSTACPAARTCACSTRGTTCTTRAATASRTAGTAASRNIEGIPLACRLAP